MSKETTPRIGTIRYTAREKEIIAIGVESDFFKLLATKLRAQRQIKLGLTLLNTAVTPDDVAFFKGRSVELDWLIRELTKVAEGYNKDNLDADTDGMDE